jgi:hypothetical protein
VEGAARGVKQLRLPAACRRDATLRSGSKFAEYFRFFAACVAELARPVDQFDRVPAKFMFGARSAS